MAGITGPEITTGLMEDILDPRSQVGVLMPVYICRWPNGDFSAVSATDRDQAIYLLDEVDNADRAEVFRAPSNFMVHFRLIDKVRDPQEFWPVELEGFGEATNELAGRLYPKYHEAKDTESGKAAALAEERTRQQPKEPKLSSDPEVRRLQEIGPDVPQALARSVVREARRKRLIDFKGPKN